MIKTTESIRSRDVERKWFVVDLAGQTVGRAATQIAHILLGKHKPSFTPNADVGDFVVAINADKVVLTGSKLSDKLYRTHTSRPGSLKEISAATMLATHPERVIEFAVRGMLPKSKLGRAQGAKLKAYAGPEHPHTAQQPESLKLS